MTRAAAAMIVMAAMLVQPATAAVFRRGGAGLNHRGFSRGFVGHSGFVGRPDVVFVPGVAVVAPSVVIVPEVVAVPAPADVYPDPGYPDPDCEAAAPSPSP